MEKREGDELNPNKLELEAAAAGAPKLLDPNRPGDDVAAEAAPKMLVAGCD